MKKERTMTKGEERTNELGQTEEERMSYNKRIKIGQIWVKSEKRINYKERAKKKQTWAKKIRKNRVGKRAKKERRKSHRTNVAADSESRLTNVRRTFLAAELGVMPSWRKVS